MQKLVKIPITKTVTKSVKLKSGRQHKFLRIFAILLPICGLLLFGAVIGFVNWSVRSFEVYPNAKMRKKFAATGIKSLPIFLLKPTKTKTHRNIGAVACIIMFWKILKPTRPNRFSV